MYDYIYSVFVHTCSRVHGREWMKFKGREEKGGMTIF